MNTFVLRFRDLVTDDGGTIREHLRIIDGSGEVWWGWWMRQHEQLPLESLRKFSTLLDETGTLIALLYDSGRDILYEAAIAKIRVAPEGRKISTPDVANCPTYYAQGSYPAWFLLTSIREMAKPLPRMVFHAFPTRPTDKELIAQIGCEVGSSAEFRQVGVTFTEIELGQG